MKNYQNSMDTQSVITCTEDTFDLYIYIFNIVHRYRTTLITYKSQVINSLLQVFRQSMSELCKEFNAMGSYLNSSKYIPYIYVIYLCIFILYNYLIFQLNHLIFFVSQLFTRFKLFSSGEDSGFQLEGTRILRTKITSNFSSKNLEKR